MWIIALLLGSVAGSEAQARDSDVWAAATTGVTLGRDTIRFGLIEARTDVLRHWNAGAALAYLDTDAGSDELQLRLTAIGTTTVGRWSLDWRQMLSASSRDLTRFRSRVRVVRPGLLGQNAVSLRAFDELFVDLEGAGVIRNNFAAGVGLQVRERCSAELYHVWVDNRLGSQSDFSMLLLTLRF
jgi:hypothetical protein